MRIAEISHFVPRSIDLAHAGDTLYVEPIEATSGAVRSTPREVAAPLGARTIAIATPHTPHRSITTFLFIESTTKSPASPAGDYSSL